ncbi:type II toxin-antitoxin system VapC family toxin [Streptomyces sp. JJ66]|uniref:type II toxin-antitoxin system VapC family toxin n=1 Tax=Streptomyces sp. JJ66 TaxID=2803843 RepID=UPI00214CB74D|nr:PIN domain-containing protein [Streptomyces sp. JJ66]
MRRVDAAYAAPAAGSLPGSHRGLLSPERQQGTRAEAAFLRSVANGQISLVPLTRGDLDRMIELVETYADFPLGAADASVLALAERLGADGIATLDRRHFTVVRPKPPRHFTLLP